VPDLDTMSEHERREAVRGWNRAGGVCGFVAGGGVLLLRPGLPMLTSDACDAIDVSGLDLAGDLDGSRLDAAGPFGRHAARTVAPEPDQLVERRLSEPGRVLRWWLANVTDDLIDADTEASIGRFAQRFPQIPLRPPAKDVVDRLDQEYRAVLPETP